MALSLSSTPEGYHAHIDRVIRGVFCIPQMCSDEKRDKDTTEDAQDMIDILRRHRNTSKLER